MIANRLDGERANRPDRKGNERNDAKRAPTMRIKRFFRQARWHETSDIDLLAIGGVASLIQRFKGVLVRRLGEFVLGLERVVGTERLR